MALIGNLKGAQGTTGTTGTTGTAGTAGTNFLSGAGTPAVGLGNNGDTYLNVTTGDVSVKSAGSWV